MTVQRTLIGLAFAYRLFGADWFPAHMEAPVYPILANQARIEGTVRLKLTLSDNGDVVEAITMLGNPLLAKAAQANAMKWKFVSPCSSTQPAEKHIELIYDFKLSGEVQATPTTQFSYDHPYRVSVVSQGIHWTP